MSNKLTAIALAFLLIPVLAILPSSAALAFSDGGGACYGEFGKEKRKMADKIINELDLSKEQMAAIEEHKKIHRAKKDALYKELREKKQALREAMHAEEIDLQKTDQLIDEITALNKEKMKSRVASVLSLKKILTLGQLKELREKKQEMKKKFLKNNNK